jgi:predicted nucleotidyltransferase
MNSDLIELLHCLNDFKVKYLVIGGYAVSYYAEPRYTKDLDLWVEASDRNAKNLIKALTHFGAPVDNLSFKDFATPGTIFVFGVAPNRIDILNKAPGASFSSAWKNRKSVRLSDLKIPFVSLLDLRKLKKAAGRPQDKIDLANLAKIKS